MEDFDDMIRKRSEYKQARTEKFKYDSKDRLSKILRKTRTLNNIVSVNRIHDWEMRQATAMH